MTVFMRITRFDGRVRTTVHRRNVTEARVLFLSQIASLEGFARSVELEVIDEHGGLFEVYRHTFPEVER